MSFTHPAWLLGALLICITLAWSWRRYDERQRRALARFVAPQLRQRLTQSVSTGRRTAQRAAFLTAVMCLCAALAGPLFGFRWEQVNRRGNEIVFALDTSRSMLTPDVKPNRLNRAKLVIDDLARQLDGNALGIVAFAGVSYLVCPITLDIAAFHESLNAIDTDTIPRGGTNMSSAIQESEAALQRRPRRRQDFDPDHRRRGSRGQCLDRRTSRGQAQRPAHLHHRRRHRRRRSHSDRRSRRLRQGRDRNPREIAARRSRAEGHRRRGRRPVHPAWGPRRRAGGSAHRRTRPDREA